MQSFQRITSALRSSTLRSRHSAVRIAPQPFKASSSFSPIANSGRKPTRFFHTSVTRWNEQKEQNEETIEKEETSENQAAEVDTKDQKIKELEEEVQDLRGQLAYSLAERENIRKIAKQDVENAREYGISKFAKGILETADNLERCLANVPKEELETNKGLSILYEGLELTEKELLRTLNSNGIKKFDPIDQKFDPNIMNALLHTPMPGKEPGTIGMVMKTGFFINERVLRPADVGVVKPPEGEESS